MAEMIDTAVHWCAKVHHVPATILCVTLFMLQAGVLDYYLISYMSSLYLCWLVADITILMVLVVSIIYGHTKLDQQRSAELTKSQAMFSTSWVSWLLININTSAKMVIIVEYNAWPMETDPSFFGPNVFKTAIALSSCIFIFLLTTQHDAALGSDRRNYISVLTGTIIFDILDTVDILEVLFTNEDRNNLWDGLEEVILTQASMNLILPTVHLVTLSLTHFGLDKPKRPKIYLHRLLVVLVVNIPNLLTRLVLWHGMSLGISPFTLKNIILIGISLYEFYEHRREKLVEPRVQQTELDEITDQSKSDVHIPSVAIGTGVTIESVDGQKQQENDRVVSNNGYLPQVSLV